MNNKDMRCQTCSADDVDAADLENCTVVEKLNKVRVAKRILAIMEE